MINNSFFFIIYTPFYFIIFRRNMAARNETALLLINNDCNDININNIIKIVNENFDNIKFIMINNELVEKDLFVNYLK